MKSKDIIATLNDLIETSKDGEYGFRASAEHIRDSLIKQELMARADECRFAAGDLQRLVFDQGGTPQEGGSASGAVHRGWVAVKSALSTYSEARILDDIERGEDLAMARYQAALATDLPPDIRLLVQQQYEGVKRNHARVRELRDRARAAAA